MLLKENIMIGFAIFQVFAIATRMPTILWLPITIVWLVAILKDNKEENNNEEVEE